MSGLPTSSPFAAHGFRAWTRWDSAREIAVSVLWLALAAAVLVSAAILGALLALGSSV